MTSSPRVDGRALREAIARVGLSQSQLAGEIHVTRQHLNGIITGERPAPAHTLRAIAARLGVTVESLQQQPTDGRPLLDVVEAAELLNVHPETLRSWLREPGRIEGAVKLGRVWRIPRSVIDRLVREGVAA